MKPPWTSGRPRPPVRMQILRLLLTAQTAVVIWLWNSAWLGVQAHAWTGIDMGLAERGLSYLLVLGPAVPVNLLAVIWLGRGGRRAQLYLSGALALTLVQLFLLLMPVDPGESIATGLHFARTVLPIAFAGAVIAVTGKSRVWLRSDAEPQRADVIGVESFVWGLTAVLALGAATSVDRWATATAQAGEPVGEYDETHVWERMEAAIAETAEAIPDFAGFGARTVEVTACGYRTGAGLLTYRYRITYDLNEADWHQYATAIDARWAEGEYELGFSRETSEGDRQITAERNDDLALTFSAAEPASLQLESPCVERVSVHPECVAPQGNIPESQDEVKGLTCPGKD